MVKAVSYIHSFALIQQCYKNNVYLVIPLHQYLPGSLIIFVPIPSRDIKRIKSIRRLLFLRRYIRDEENHYGNNSTLSAFLMTQ